MIIEVLGDGVYRLKIQDGELILQTWNATNLKFYFSSDIWIFISFPMNVMLFEVMLFFPQKGFFNEVT